MKVGDKVAVMYSGTTSAIGIIDRETKLYWIVGNEKFRKSDNKQPGEFSWGCSPYTIVPATQEHINSLRKSKLVLKLHNQSWHRLDLETLEKVFAIVCGVAETKENKQ